MWPASSGFPREHRLLLAVSGTLNLDAQGFNQAGASLSIAGGLSNTGTVNVDTSGGAGGGTLTLTGVLANSGTTNIGTGGGNLSAPTTVSAAGLSNTGTINIEGNTAVNTTAQATLNIAAAAPGTWTGTANLTGDALIAFGSGEITSVGNGARLALSGAKARIADSSTPGSSSALTGLTNVTGDFELQYGASVAVGSLNVSGTLNIDTQAFDSTGSSLTVGGDLANSGNVSVGRHGFRDGGGSLAVTGTLNNTGTLAIDNDTAQTTQVTAATLANTGTLLLNTNGSGKSVLNIAGAAPNALAGTVTLAGNSLLEVGNGSIASIAAGDALTIASANAFLADASDLTHNSALSGLQSIAGNLTLQGGSAVTTTGPLAISGSLALQGSTLTTGGAVTVGGNGGTLNIDATSTLAVTSGNSFTQQAGTTTTVSGALTAALIEVAGGKFDYVKSIIDQAFELGDGGLLEFGNSVDATSTVTFTDGTGTVQLDMPGSFAATIAGAQVGDVFHLIDTPVTALSYANNTLTVSGSGGTVASLTFTGTYNTSDFGFQSDGSGGTYITVV
jgi:hypothetical protein